MKILFPIQGKIHIASIVTGADNQLVGYFGISGKLLVIREYNRITQHRLTGVNDGTARYEGK